MIAVESRNAVLHDTQVACVSIVLKGRCKILQLIVVV